VRVDRYEGFREFFAARRSALSRAAFLLTGSVQAAEELLQEALVRTLARWPKVTADGNSPEAYVRKVMLNEVRNQWRRRQVRVEDPTDLPPEVAGRSDLENQAADRQVLAVALRKLGPRQRAVLFLRFYEDLPEAECARLLGCSVGTVKSQTHDAVKRLRELAPELRFRYTEAMR
jgi:RNA polymerase sigma-70 factor (sigma-E family)